MCKRCADATSLPPELQTLAQDGHVRVGHVRVGHVAGQKGTQLGLGELLRPGIVPQQRNQSA